MSAFSWPSPPRARKNLRRRQRFPMPLGPLRSAGVAPRDLGSNPRALKRNPRAAGVYKNDGGSLYGRLAHTAHEMRRSSERAAARGFVRQARQARQNEAVPSSVPRSSPHHWPARVSVTIAGVEHKINRAGGIVAIAAIRSELEQLAEAPDDPL